MAMLHYSFLTAVIVCGEEKVGEGLVKTGEEGLMGFSAGF